MQKKLSRAIAALAASSMIAASLAGCANSNPNVNSTSERSQTNAAADSVRDKSAAPKDDGSAKALVVPDKESLTDEKLASWLEENASWKRDFSDGLIAAVEAGDDLYVFAFEGTSPSRAICAKEKWSLEDLDQATSGGVDTVNSAMDAIRDKFSKVMDFPGTEYVYSTVELMRASYEV